MLVCLLQALHSLRMHVHVYTCQGSAADISVHSSQAQPAGSACVLFVLLGLAETYLMIYLVILLHTSLLTTVKS